MDPSHAPLSPGRRQAFLLIHAGAFGALLASCAGTGPIAQDPVPPAPAAEVPPEPSTPPPEPNPADAIEPEPQQADATIDPTAPAVPPSKVSPLSGYLSMRYRGRWTSSESDHDLRAVLGIDYEDSAHPGFSAHFLGRVSADFDGGESSTSVFGSLSDTYDSDVEAQLYHAYGELTPVDGPGTLRFGRQLDYLTPEVAHFDGVAVESQVRGEKKVRAGIYGGVPVHLYESSSSGDLILGTFVEGKPWKSGRVRLDWMHLEDEVLLGEFNDDLLAAGLWQTLGEHWTADANYSALEGKNRDLRLRAGYATEEGDLAARFSYYELLTTQTQSALEVDPFTDVLIEYFPFRQAGVVVSRQLDLKTSLDLGFDMRRVSDEGDVGEFNRDWERYNATLTRRDLFASGVDASLIGDLWEGDEDDQTAFGADLSRDFGPAWKVSGGTYFSRYKYDLELATEKDDVRTYYARARWKKNPSLSFELGYEYEDDDFDQYHQVRGGALWRF